MRPYNNAPCWSVSLAVRPQKNAPHWRTLSCATDFDHQGSQWSAPHRRTLSSATDFDHEGLNDLPLIRGLCLVQQTLTTRVSMICPLLEDFVLCNGLQPPRVSMICPLSEDFVSCNVLQPPGVSMICPLSEDFVSCTGLWPQRASMICPSLEDFVLYQWWTLITMGHKMQTGANGGEQQCRWGIKRMYYLDKGGRFCVGCLVNARMITALGWGQRLHPKSLWARSNNDTQWGLGSRAWIW